MINDPTKKVGPRVSEGPTVSDTTTSVTANDTALSALWAVAEGDVEGQLSVDGYSARMLIRKGWSVTPPAELVDRVDLDATYTPDERAAIARTRATRLAHRVVDAELDAAGQVELESALRLFAPGGTFIFDEPEGFSAIWGTGDLVLWTEGEALIVAGPQGVGKSTLVGNVVAALIGDTVMEVLGFPVRPGLRVLYLAMDRPRQLARSMRRQLGHLSRDVLDDRLVVWKGPPPRDLAKNTDLLVARV